jgi:hypothetical protein
LIILCDDHVDGRRQDDDDRTQQSKLAISKPIESVDSQ